MGALTSWRQTALRGTGRNGSQPERQADHGQHNRLFHSRLRIVDVAVVRCSGRTRGKLRRTEHKANQPVRIEPVGRWQKRRNPTDRCKPHGLRLHDERLCRAGRADLGGAVADVAAARLRLGAGVGSLRRPGPGPDRSESNRAYHHGSDDMMPRKACHAPGIPAQRTPVDDACHRCVVRHPAEWAGCGVNANAEGPCRRAGRFEK